MTRPAEDATWLEGPFGCAELIPTPPDHPNAETAVATWFMFLPEQGIAWDRFLLGVVSLQDVPGRPPPFKRYPRAEYEMLVVALAADLDPKPHDMESWQPMEPHNFAGQFHGVTREQAATIARAMAYGCVTGRLMAETQVYVAPAPGEEGDGKMMVVKHLVDQWTLSLARTVEHERTGGLHARIN